VKTYPLTFLVFCLAAALPAQTPAPVLDTNRTPEELDRLLAPIALYPDALVALILPAATAPTDIVLAAASSRPTSGGQRGRPALGRERASPRALSRHREVDGCQPRVGRRPSARHSCSSRRT